jgi:hypothetical protein
MAKKFSDDLIHDISLHMEVSLEWDIDAWGGSGEDNLIPCYEFLISNAREEFFGRSGENDNELIAALREIAEQVVKENYAHA